MKQKSEFSKRADDTLAKLRALSERLTVLEKRERPEAEAWPWRRVEEQLAKVEGDKK
jgi:hypothetical protein